LFATSIWEGWYSALTSPRMMLLAVRAGHARHSANEEIIFLDAKRNASGTVSSQINCGRRASLSKPDGLLRCAVPQTQLDAHRHILSRLLTLRLSESESDYRHKKQKTQSYSEHGGSLLCGRTINSHRELPCSTKPASTNATAGWRFPQQPFHCLSVLNISVSCGAQLDCCEEVHHDPHDRS